MADNSVSSDPPENSEARRGLKPFFALAAFAIPLRCLVSVGNCILFTEYICISAVTAVAALNGGSHEYNPGYTRSVKIVLSVPDYIFHLAEDADPRLGISRSHLCATAIAEYVRKQRTDTIVDRLNKVDSETPAKWTHLCRVPSCILSQMNPGKGRQLRSAVLRHQPEDIA